MFLNKIKMYQRLVLTLIFSFSIQPAFAAFISTSMLVPPMSVSGMSVSGQTQNSVAPVAHQDCPHMMMDGQMLQTVQSGSMTGDCLTNCQFCMAISFILPSVLAKLPSQEIFIPSDALIKQLVSIVCIPAHEPPRFFS